MSATNFNTSNSTYRKLIGNGLTYQIPPFQRDYSWEEEQWEDLWQDILDVTSSEHDSAHYMGYLVLQSGDEKTFDIIDGQQRLTTLTLIVLAALKNLQQIIDNGEDAERNKQRYEQIRQTYVGYLDPVTLVSKTKLTLNRNNDSYFQNYIVTLRELPTRGFKASEHTLRKSFGWFHKKVSEYIKNCDGDKGIAIARLIENMSDRLFFTVISVTDELNAYKVFETLNARGVRLSSTDLLKNYLFSVIHKENQDAHELKVLEDRWESIVSRLGSESFPDFLRAYWVSRNKSVRHAELYKAVRNTVKSRESVFSLLRGMEEDIDTYLALSSPELSVWNENLKRHSRTLKLFSVKQVVPLLMAAYRKLNIADFEALMRHVVVISYRYNVIGNLPPNEQEKLYQHVAQKVSLGEFNAPQMILSALKSIYPSDELFKSLFTEKILNTTNTRNAKIVRFTFAEIEKHLTGNEYDFASDDYSIEHILPQSAESGWEQFDDAEVEAMTFRLGNMCLLEKSINRDIANLPFAQKKLKLTGSTFMLTTKIATENTEWTPERISTRQSYLATQATAVWRISQLS